MSKKKQLYNIIKGIRSTTLGKAYRAGERGIDLSDWPKEVIEQWLKDGVIEKANGK